MVPTRIISELVDDDRENDPFAVGSTTSLVYSVLGEPTYKVPGEGNSRQVLYYMSTLDTSTARGFTKTNGIAVFTEGGIVTEWQPILELVR
jgi:hypothetical protein